MKLKQLGTLGLLTGLAQAFLVPPTLHSADREAVEALPFEALTTAEGRVLELSCPGCPIEAAKGTSASWTRAKSMLRLNATIESTSTRHDVLRLNGVQIMPVDATASLQGLFADQFVQTPDGLWAYSSSPQLGYSLSIKPYSDGKQDLTMYAVHLRIIEVANEFVRHVPVVDLKIISTPTGKLMVVDSVIQTNIGSTTAISGGETCNTLLCKWKALLAGKVGGFKKGCGRKNGESHRIPRPYGIKGGRPKPEGFGRPHPHGQYHHRRPHGNAIYRFLRALTFHVLVPVLVGMGIGITASVVGMLVGNLIVFVWRILFRRGERGRCRNRYNKETEEDCEDESKGFLEGQGPPPVYEEIIVMEEKTGK